MAEPNTIAVMRMKSQLIAKAGIPIHNLDIDRLEDQEAIVRIYDLWWDSQVKKST